MSSLFGSGVRISFLLSDSSIFDSLVSVSLFLGNSSIFDGLLLGIGFLLGCLGLSGGLLSSKFGKLLLFHLGEDLLSSFLNFFVFGLFLSYLGGLLLSLLLLFGLGFVNSTLVRCRFSNDFFFLDGLSFRGSLYSSGRLFSFRNFAFFLNISLRLNFNNSFSLEFVFLDDNGSIFLLDGLDFVDHTSGSGGIRSLKRST
jgi:hypothetical protein